MEPFQNNERSPSNLMGKFHVFGALIDCDIKTVYNKRRTSKSVKI